MPKTGNTQHKYPAILTNKDWQKKKGLLGKMAGETGVGDAMDALQKSYEKVNWKIFDPGAALPFDRDLRGIEGIKMVIKNAQAEYNSSISSAVHSNLADLKTKVTDAQKEFKKSKTIPKKLGDHCDDILSAIADMETETSSENLVEELKKNAEQLLKDQAAFNKMMAETKQRLKKYVVALAQDIKTVKTSKDYYNSWSENIRGVGTALPVLAEGLGLLEVHKRWRGYASQANSTATDEEVPERYKALTPDLKLIAAAVK